MEILNYLNKPWKPLAFGPDAYFCWGLFRAFYKNEFKIELPKYVTVNPENIVQVTKSLIKGSNHSNWIKLDKPVHGCAVLMGSGKFPTHIGTYLDIDKGLILHTTKSSGSVVTPYNSLYNQFLLNVTGLYLHKDLV